MICDSFNFYKVFKVCLNQLECSFGDPSKIGNSKPP